MEAVAKIKILPEEEEETYYPESDGKPMAETDVHIDQLIYLKEALRDYFRDQDDAYVAGNLFVYFREGDKSACVAPDIFVVRGVKKERRRIYKTWEEGKGPELVIELTSKSTSYEDMQTKWRIYEKDLRVKEYFLYDPLKEYLDLPLQGYRLIRGQYKVIAQKKGRLRSEVLGLELGVEEGWLRLYDPRTGEKLLTPMEQAEALRKEAEARRKEVEARRKAEEMAKQAEEKAKKEAEARVDAEEELVRLRAELEALRNEG